MGRAAGSMVAMEMSLSASSRLKESGYVETRDTQMIQNNSTLAMGNYIITNARECPKIFKISKELKII